jgi:hypothetical protein
MELEAGDNIIVKENSFARPMKLIRFEVLDVTYYSILLRNKDEDPATQRRLSKGTFNALYDIIEVL